MPKSWQIKHVDAQTRGLIKAYAVLHGISIAAALNIAAKLLERKRESEKGL